MALAARQRRRATEFFHMLNPSNHGRTPAEVARYKTEPYVMAGDVYARPPHAGRGGWSWYTGSAGWMYRAGVESILGLRRRGDTFVIDPCIPSSWDHYRIDWRFMDSLRDRRVQPWGPVPRHHDATLDGALVNAAAIPLLNDGGLTTCGLFLESTECRPVVRVTNLEPDRQDSSPRFPSRL
jgi:cyclic beta-1,2-glucan synthetase